MFEEADSIPEPPGEEETAFKQETEAKVKEMFISQNIPTVINTYSLADKEALAIKDFFPKWEEDIDVKQGERYQDSGLLWKCRKDHHTQLNWKPSLNTASLWEIVEIKHKGTFKDPIPYKGNMTLENGKYYSQDSKLYRCIRNSEIPVYHPLSELVGIYVEEVK